MIGKAGTRSSSDRTKTEPTDVVLCLGIFCLIGVACRHLLRTTRVPYTVALLIIGIALGCLGLLLHSPSCLPHRFLFSLLSTFALQLGYVESVAWNELSWMNSSYSKQIPKAAMQQWKLFSCSTTEILNETELAFRLASLSWILLSLCSLHLA